MSNDERPDVVDLRSYRKARQAQAAQKKPAPRPAAGKAEPLLGSRPRAGLVLVVVVLVLAALWLAPRLI